MAGEGSTRTTHREIGVEPALGRPPGWRRGLLHRMRRIRLGLITLLPALALAAVFVAEPFAGMHTVDEPTGPAPAASPTPYAGFGR